MILEVELALLGSNLLENEEGRTFADVMTTVGTKAQAASVKREMNTIVTRGHVSIAEEQTTIRRLQGLFQLPETRSFPAGLRVQEK